MNTITFDKLEYINSLKSSGVDDHQAQAMANALDKALRDTVATKHDMELLRRDVKIWIMAQTTVIISILSAIKFFG